MRQFLIFCLALIAGCVSKSVETKTTFNPAEVSYILEPGQGVIRGKAYLKKGIYTHKAAGRQVELVPVSTYAQERMKTIFGNGNTQQSSAKVVFSSNDPSYDQYKKRAFTDPEGIFEFTEVPDGNYYLTTRVIWGDKPDDNALIRKQVTVSDGNAQTIILDGT